MRGSQQEGITVRDQSKLIHRKSCGVEREVKQGCEGVMSEREWGEWRYVSGCDIRRIE